jgi:hypothetical protein
LTTNAAGSYWSVTASSSLFYLVKQLEFVASGGDALNFVRPATEAGSTAVSRHFVTHRLAIIGAGLAVCFMTLFVALTTMVYATRKLAMESRPYFVEVWLLLQSQLYYTSAYAASASLGLCFFAPFELSIGSDLTRFLVALSRSAGFFLIARELCRRYN